MKQLQNNYRWTLLKYALATVATLAVSAALVAAQGENPLVVVQGIFNGAFGGTTKIGNTLRWVTPYMIAALAASVAFKSGVNNLGIDGQIYFGAFVAGVLGYTIQLPPVLHVAVCLICGALAGALYALIPAILRLFFHLNEMVVTLMLNYVAGSFTVYFVIMMIGKGAASGSVAQQLPVIADNAMLPTLIKGTTSSMGIFIALFVFAILYFTYHYTIKGYELKQVGESMPFARAGGVKVLSTYLTIFLLSGAISGLCGAVEVCGAYRRFTSGFAGTTGWEGIMIAKVAKNNPVAVVVVSIIWGALKAGALHMERISNLNRLTVVLVQAMFVLFVTIDWERLYLNLKSTRQKAIAKKGTANA